MQTSLRFLRSVWLPLAVLLISSAAPANTAFAQGEAGFVLIPSALAPIPAGGLTREVFLNVAGGTLADLTNNARFPSHPDIVDSISDFETPSQFADNYGERVSGYLVPPTTGNYVFYISADDQAALFLSSSADPADKKQIAAEYSWSFPRSWIDKSVRTNQANISSPVWLQAGNAYYIEALHKEFGGGDCLAVAWQMPGSAEPANGGPPISGQYLRATAPSNQPPVISLSSTLGGTRSTNSEPVWIFASASDPDGHIEQVEFFAGTVSLGIVTQPLSTLNPGIAPSAESLYGISWTNAPVGEHELTAVATDDLGLTTASAPVHISVVSAETDAHGLKREVFLGIPGGRLADLTNSAKFPSLPNTIDRIPNFETPSQYADNYGARISGFVLAPVTGNYIFYISADDEAALYLSSDINPTNKQQIATVTGWDMPRTWINSSAGTNNANTSAPIYLQSGHPYYIEALMKEAAGGDHLGVAWQKPGDPQVVNGDPPIPAEFLVQVAPTNQPPTVVLARPVAGNGIEPDSSVPVSAWVEDPDGSIVQVEFFAGKTSLGVVTEPESIPYPYATAISKSLYSVVWSNAPAGELDLTAVALDDRKTITTSPPVHVVVAPLPEVTLTAPDPTASEPGLADGDTATCLVSRTGSTSNALSVAYLIEGSAQNGGDFTMLSGEVTIEAGQSEATIQVVPQNDAFVEGPETVKLTLTDMPLVVPMVWPPITPVPSYRIGEPSSAVATIADFAVSNVPPTVTITAVDSYATTSQDALSKAAKFRVRRSGDTTYPLSVWFTATGTAVNGVDYKAISNFVTIPAGKRAARIVIDPVHSVIDGDKTVILTLNYTALEAKNAWYEIGSPSVAAAVIADIDLAKNKSVRTPELVGGEVHLLFSAVGTASYNLEVSTDLVTWTPVAQATANNGVVGYVDPQDQDQSCRFYRVRPILEQAAVSDEE